MGWLSITENRLLSDTTRFLYQTLFGFFFFAYFSKFKIQKKKKKKKIGYEGKTDAIFYWKDSTVSDLLVLEFVAFDSPMEMIVFPLIHHSQILCDTKYPILFVKSLQKSHSFQGLIQMALFYYNPQTLIKN